MYKKDMGKRIKYLRKNVCGYSQRRLAKLVNEDVETIRMIENGQIKNPQPQLILRIAEALDSFYMEFVKKEYEDEFLYYIDWGTYNHEDIVFLKDFSLLMSSIIISSKLRDKEPKEILKRYWR